MIRTRGFTQFRRKPSYPAGGRDIGPAAQQVSQTGLVQKRKRVFFFLLAVFFVGMMYGSILLRDKSGGFLKSLGIIQETFLADKAEQSVFQCFCGSLGSSLLFFGCSFLCSLSAVGQPMAVLSLFLKGLGLGSSMGYLYLHYGLSGIGYSALFLLPSGAIAVFALLLSVKESLRLSNLLFSALMRGGEQISKSVWKLYLCKHGVLLLILGLSALIDTLITFFFAGVFHLAP
jgi:hypothetical protein